MTVVQASDAQTETQAEVIARLEQLQFVQGQFEQRKQLQGLSYPLQSRGEFLFWRARGLYLETTQPFFSASTLTPDEIFHWNEDGSTVLAREQSGIVQREINRTLLAFFSADLGLIEQRFESDWQFGDDEWQLTLIPRLDIVAKNIKLARLRGDSFLQSLYLEAANGDITELTFSDVSQAPAPSFEQCLRFFRVDADELCRAAALTLE